MKAAFKSIKLLLSLACTNTQINRPRKKIIIFCSITLINNSNNRFFSYILYIQTAISYNFIICINIICYKSCVYLNIYLCVHSQPKFNLLNKNFFVIKFILPKKNSSFSKLLTDNMSEQRLRRTHIGLPRTANNK